MNTVKITIGTLALVIIVGIPSGCTPSGGVEVGASLKRAEMRVAHPPESNSRGALAIVTPHWEKTRDTVDCISAALAQSPGLTLVPITALRRSVYQWNGLDFQDLQRIISEPEAKSEIASVNLHYIVVINEVTETDDTFDDPCLFTCAKSSLLRATIWNLDSGEQMAEASASATGRQVAPAPFIFPILPLWFDPATEKTACSAVSAKLLDYFGRSSEQQWE